MDERGLTALLARMTLDEKIGQLVQLDGRFLGQAGGPPTGPLLEMGIRPAVVAAAGSLLGISGAAAVRSLQQRHLRGSRLGIPLLFMHDVIHGYRTVYPIPLAMGCTFDPGLLERAARMAATEAAAAGLHVTFSPMCDLVRDARWGRVMETTGEDARLNGLFAAAQVRGYQGAGLAAKDAVAACVKHYAAYGAVEGGREYETVDVSERTLRGHHLPAYRAAVDAGCAMVMTSFNTVDGIPASGNRRLLSEILRAEWGFRGTVISDWAAVEELISHGVAEDRRAAAGLAIRAGVDIEMMSPCYANHLAELVASGKVDVRIVDEAVLRVLRLKNDLGLFENPLHGADEGRETAVTLCAEHRAIAREAAQRSMVLLENEGVLPLDRAAGRIGVVGPYAEARHVLGGWSCLGRDEEAVPLREAIAEKAGAGRVLAATGCDVEGDRLDLAAVAAVLRDADAIVLAVGEHPGMSGEAGSRASIGLPGRQRELCEAVLAAGKPCAVVLFGGRPLDVAFLAGRGIAILMAWFPGTEGTRAAADLLFGDAEPRGRLCMGFPRAVGQLPLYYNRFRTGRPRTEGTTDRYKHGYRDLSTEPLYPFGHGLSYTTFAYDRFEIDRSSICRGDTVTASVTVTNTGDRPGHELVMLHVADVVGSVVRPVRELKGFRWVALSPGEAATVSVSVTEADLRFHDADMRFVSEPGLFRAFLGGAGEALGVREFRLEG